MRVIAFSTWLCLTLLPTSGVSAEVQEEEPGRAVRLVLVINVDSMIPEQLTRLNVWWKGGFRRLLDEGTRFVEAELPYANTESAVGHASFATGCLPARHGICREALIDADSPDMTPCVYDENARTLSSSDWLVAEEGSASGHRMQRDGWAAALRTQWPGSRSLSIAGRGSSAALLGGRSTQLALWWDSYGRGFVSSSAYAKELPAWLDEWNEGWPVAVRDWSWQAQLPGNPQLTGTAADDRAGEAPVAGRAPVFPYPALELPETLDARSQAALAGRVFVTPLMDRFVCELAMHAVRANGLGADEEPDLLAISLGSCDVLARATGPYSLEVTDALLRADVQLGRLFECLDEELGRGSWMVAMSSDHGLLELPEGDPSRSAGGVRLRVRSRRMALQLLRSGLEGEFGESFGVNLTPGADAVTFAPGALTRAGSPAGAVRARAAEIMRRVAWVADTYTREQLQRPAAAGDDPWLRLARNSYRSAGGAEVLVRLAHRHLLGVRSGTRAGSPYAYDRRQSLIFMGPGIAADTRTGRASSLDALPTVFGRLGRGPLEGLSGRDLLGP